MEIHKSNIPYYVLAIGIFIGLKFSAGFASNDDLIFLLKPTDKIVGWLSGSHSVYSPEYGFYHSSLKTIIEKSCSGFDFMLLCFCMLTFLCLKYIFHPVLKAFIIPFCLIISYTFTIFINASRIFASIIMQQQANSFLTNRPHYKLHEIVGVVTFLSFLILIYFFTEKFLNRYFKNAKSPQSQMALSD